MPTFTFIGGTPRYYASLGVTANPGGVHDLDEPPDRWWMSTQDEPQKRAEKKPPETSPENPEPEKAEKSDASPVETSTPEEQA